MERVSGLPDKLRQWPVVADEVVRAAREIGELSSGDVDPQTVIERGEDVAEMNRLAARLLAPARGRTEHLPAAQAPARNERAGDQRHNLVHRLRRLDSRLADAWG